MLAYGVYVLKVASIDGPVPFLVACHCTIFVVNLLFVICVYLANEFLSVCVCVFVPTWTSLRRSSSDHSIDAARLLLRSGADDGSKGYFNLRPKPHAPPIQALCSTIVRVIKRLYVCTVCMYQYRLFAQINWTRRRTHGQHENKSRTRKAQKTGAYILPIKNKHTRYKTTTPTHTVKTQRSLHD